jgi:hypothetical protein
MITYVYNLFYLDYQIVSAGRARTFRSPTGISYHYNLVAFDCVQSEVCVGTQQAHETEKASRGG